MKVLFRIESGSSIGLGHLQRSLCLATALRKIDVESIFLGPDDQRSIQRVERFGFVCETLENVTHWTSEEINLVVEIGTKDLCQVVVVDSPQVRLEYLAQLKEAGFFVVCRDDIASKHSFPCQMVVNGNADAFELPYRTVSNDTMFLLGPEFMVLGEEYLVTPLRQTRKEVRNILILLGGTDQYELMPKILKLLKGISESFHVTAIVGPFFHNHSSIQLESESIGELVSLVVQPDSLLEFMCKADLAISASGQTLYELARVGCPTIAIKTADNQDGQYNALKKMGVIWAAGDATGADNVIESIEEAIETLVSDVDARARMSIAGQRLIDGKGAHRVAQAIYSEINEGNI